MGRHTRGAQSVQTLRDTCSPGQALQTFGRPFATCRWARVMSCFSWAALCATARTYSVNAVYAARRYREILHENLHMHSTYTFAELFCMQMCICNLLYKIIGIMYIMVRKGIVGRRRSRDAQRSSRTLTREISALRGLVCDGTALFYKKV